MLVWKQGISFFFISFHEGSNLLIRTAGRSDFFASSQVSVVGGSVAGLLAAREIAHSGIEVQVFEEHREIGVPEKCDGLVSSRGISELGLVPPFSVVQNRLEKAILFSPSMKEIKIDARKQKVIVLDRSRFDKYLAEEAAKAGAILHVGTRISGYEQESNENLVRFRIDSQELNSEYLIDASGYESYIRSGGKTIQGAQYLVYGSWFNKSTVEVYIDPVGSPSFFTWVIPISHDLAKIGIGGEGINTFKALDKFAESKKAAIIRKMAAPIVCFGLVKEFVKGRLIRVGDAAGQAKPTTGGGIFTGGYGGLLAGRAVAQSIKENSPDLLREQYESAWRRRFAREFALQSRARNIVSKLSRDQVDKLFEIVGSSDVPRRISEESDFDLHSTAFAKVLGYSNVATILGIVITNELRSLFGL
jgi:digeranylgeranylglycerophospholipid reductase